MCINRAMFEQYEKLESENVFMGNSASAKVSDKGKTTLKFTFGEFLTVTNVLHVHEMCRNLICGSLLIRASLRLSFDSDRLVITHNEEFMGKRYCNGGAFYY